MSLLSLMRNAIPIIRFMFAARKAIWRKSMGRLHVWRDAPDWAVFMGAQLYAESTFDPEAEKDTIGFEVLRDAHEEANLRMRRMAIALNAMTQKLKELMEQDIRKEKEQ